MTPAFHPDELGTGTPPEERIDLKSIAQRLEADTPLPSPGFRGDLRRALLGSAQPLARPAGLRRLIALYGFSGALLLLAGAAGAAGVGPLGT